MPNRGTSRVAVGGLNFGAAFVGKSAMIGSIRQRPHGRPVAFVAAILALIVPTFACHRLHAQEPAAKPDAGTHKFTNKLIGSSSPYLLEHAHNPVNWYPWGEEALSKARIENKPIFLSVGYMACHWCHVMAREDFENEEIANILNAHFVAIKVDREQRPDIDAQYMLAVQMMTGSGGWPMSVILTSDRKPFFGGTYFPPAEFKELLNKVVDVVAKRPEAVREQADKIAAAVADASRPAVPGALTTNILDRVVQGLRQRFDAAEGGFAKQPKFPEAPNLAFLLARYRKTHDKTALAMVTRTLDHMAAGGIYDQIGGGFHRYSTDAIWRVPHFEKMLYDQAQLALVYLDAFEITHVPRYRQIVEETLAFVEREMRDGEGGFMSTLDADSEGQEGKFYLWTPDQFREVLGDDAPLFEAVYGVSASGDLDGKSVLHSASTIEEVAAAHHLSAAELTHRMASMREKLLQARAKRVRPRTDDKVLASWNGLMIATYARANRVLGVARYGKVAAEAARFVMLKMMPDGRLRHCYRAGVVEVPGLLEDYAYFAFGLLELADSSHEAHWRDSGRDLARQMIETLGDAQAGGFYTHVALADLLARMKEGTDNATPSPNGVAAQVLVRLADATADQTMRREALRTIEAFQPLEVRSPAAFPTLLTAYQELDMTAPITAASVVEARSELVTAGQGAQATILVRVRIRPGWHINAHRPSADYLIGTRLSLAPDSNVELIRVDYPDGDQKQFAYSSDRLSVYQGDVVIRAMVRLKRSTSPGRIALPFTLYYQPCNERACQAPTQLAISAPVVVS